MIEKKHRIEDALEAVRSAQQQGVIAGGGSTLAKITDRVEIADIPAEQKLGFKIVVDARAAPLRQMAENAGESPDLIVQKVKGVSANCGYNFMSGQLENFFDTGIIDPVKVTISAIQNAVSVASTLITTNHAIIKM
jgi:chaperonin GroEL